MIILLLKTMSPMHIMVIVLDWNESLPKNIICGEIIYRFGLDHQGLLDESAVYFESDDLVTCYLDFHLLLVPCGPEG